MACYSSTIKDVPGWDWWIDLQWRLVSHGKTLSYRWYGLAGVGVLYIDLFYLSTSLWSYLYVPSMLMREWGAFGIEAAAAFFTVPAKHSLRTIQS